MCHGVQSSKIDTQSSADKFKSANLNDISSDDDRWSNSFKTKIFCATTTELIGGCCSALFTIGTMIIFVCPMVLKKQDVLISIAPSEFVGHLCDEVQETMRMKRIRRLVHYSHSLQWFQTAVSVRCIEQRNCAWLTLNEIGSIIATVDLILIQNPF
eukprot:767850_1